jgi:hypothetical protein
LSTSADHIEPKYGGGVGTDGSTRYLNLSKTVFATRKRLSIRKMNHVLTALDLFSEMGRMPATERAKFFSCS